MAFVSNTWQLVGITSEGYGCALPGHSGVYTRVAYYIPFIDTIKNETQTQFTAVTAGPYSGCDKLQTTMIINIGFITLTVLLSVFQKNV
jgi:secreted trypsin-like serine protease